LIPITTIFHAHDAARHPRPARLPGARPSAVPESTLTPPQLLFGAVILGLSITLAKGQTRGYKVPATTGYGSFCGAFALVAALIGIAAALAPAVPDIVSWAVDGLAALLLVAGGIAFAVGLKGVNCGLYDITMAFNDIINCGFKGKKDPHCTPYTCGATCRADTNEKVQGDYMMGRCRTARADEVFLFLAFLVTGVALAFSFVTRGKGRSGYAV
jgi:hypothetical protein